MKGHDANRRLVTHLGKEADASFTDLRIAVIDATNWKGETGATLHYDEVHLDSFLPMFYFQTPTITARSTWKRRHRDQRARHHVHSDAGQGARGRHLDLR